MNARIILFCLSFLPIWALSASGKSDSKEIPVPESRLRLCVEADLYDFSKVWSDRFSIGNSSQAIELIDSGTSQLNLDGESEDMLYILSDFRSHDIIKSFSWKMILGQEVLVPIMNSDNPLAETICAKGVSMDGLRKVTENPALADWSELLAQNSNSRLQVYISKNQFVVEALSKLIGHKVADQIEIVSAEELIRKVQNDKTALGFCTLSSLSETGNEKMPEGVSIVPIDKNGNGKIDYVESIYTDLQSFSRGVWIGKYPKAFCNSIYAASNGKPTSAKEVAFLKWIITDGQQFLNESGFSEIVFAGRQSQLAQFDAPDELASVPVEKAGNLPSIFVLVVVCVVGLGVILELVYFRSARRSSKAGKFAAPVGPFDLQSLDMPQGYYFDKTHTWAFLRKNGTVKIGLNDFVTHLTGDVSKVELKSAGDKIKKGEPVCSIVNKGRILKFYSPISGVIAETNTNLDGSPSLLKKSPYSAGWIYVVQPLNWSLENQYLTLGEVYKSWVGKEFTRLMDFITKSIKVKDSKEFSQFVLQDGGLLKDNFLDDLEPKIWEDFQTEFIDTSK